MNFERIRVSKELNENDVGIHFIFWYLQILENLNRNL